MVLLCSFVRGSLQFDVLAEVGLFSGESTRDVVLLYLKLLFLGHQLWGEDGLDTDLPSIIFAESKQVLVDPIGDAGIETAVVLRSHSGLGAPRWSLDLVEHPVPV